MTNNIIRQDAALRETADAAGVPLDVLAACLRQHDQFIARYDHLDRYYRGLHPILARRDMGSGRPNNRIVANHAKYITDMAVGYLLGDAVKYQSGDGQDISELLARYRVADVASVDPEIAKDMSIFGLAVELLYYSDDEKPIPKAAYIDPRLSFVVHDDTVESRPLFGVHKLPQYDRQGELDHFSVTVYTATRKWPYRADRSLGSVVPDGEAAPHRFGDIPMSEYPNNEERMGDFETVLGLIDAYNLLQSDRVNDVERFVQSILFLKGFTLDDETAKRLRTDRILETNAMDAGADAKWLVNALDQANVEVIRQTLEADIHKFAMVPELTDENFAGNASGVAMKFKLLGFDQMIKIKERYMEKGLRNRMRLFLSAPNWSNTIVPENVGILFTHSLPVNELEMAQMVSQLRGTVSSETLLGLLPFVPDPAGEVQKLNEEKKENLQRQQDAFSQQAGSKETKEETVPPEV